MAQHKQQQLRRLELDTRTHTTSDMQKAAANKVGSFIAQVV